MTKTTALQIKDIRNFGMGCRVTHPMFPRLKISMDVVCTWDEDFSFSVGGVVIAQAKISETECSTCGPSTEKHKATRFDENMNHLVFPIIDALGFDWVATDFGSSGVEWAVDGVSSELFGLPPELNIPVSGVVAKVWQTDRMGASAVVLDIGANLSAVITYQEVHPGLLEKGFEFSTMQFDLIERDKIPQGTLVDILAKDEYRSLLQSIAKISKKKQVKGDHDLVAKNWE